MLKTIDLNADLGEYIDLTHSNLDGELMPLISSCNIACGGHAGDHESMQKSVQLAIANEVSIGAHPSYPDRTNFGRVSMNISKSDLAKSLTNQILNLQNIAKHAGAKIRHVKPHGALYNEAADDDQLATLICETIVKLNPNLALLGLANSAMKEAAQKTGLEFWNEAFVDRRYDNRLRLVSRKIEGAVLNHSDGLDQLKTYIQNGKIITNERIKLSVQVDSFCLHSDTPDAIQMAKSIVEFLNQEAIEIRSIK